MEVEETEYLSLNEMRLQLNLYEIRERRKSMIEWGACLMNCLIHSHVSGMRGIIRVDKGERPDFQMHFPEIQHGIHFEVTIAASQAHQAALRIMQNDPTVKFLEPSTYSASPALTARHREVGIGREGDSLGGPGWGGWQAENQWVEFIERAIENKVTKFYDYGFDQLVIYDDSPVSGWINTYLAVKLILKRPKIDENFMINIWSGNHFIHDLYGKGCRLYNVEKIHLSEEYFPYMKMLNLDRPGKNVICSSKNEF